MCQNMLHQYQDASILGYKLIGIVGNVPKYMIFNSIITLTLDVESYSLIPIGRTIYRSHKTLEQ